MQRIGTVSGVCIVPAAPYADAFPRYSENAEDVAFADTSHPRRPLVHLHATFVSHGRVVPAEVGSRSSEWGPPHRPTTCVRPTTQDSVFSSVTLTASDTLAVKRIFWVSYTPQGLL